jgi:hypothetical protein
MRSTFSTLFYLKRNEPKKNGNVVIMVRITVDGECVQFSSKLEIHPDLWDDKIRKAKGSSANAVSTNRTLDTIRASVAKYYTHLMEVDGYATPTKIKNLLLGIEGKEKTIINIF